MAQQYVIGIDVGTGSARAGVFNLSGSMAGMAVQPIQMWRPRPDFVEQSSEDIWRSVCAAVKKAMRAAQLGPTDVVGVAFDATCSLVAIDEQGGPVSLSPTGRDEQNIIVWMDHRAMAEAAQITRSQHEVLRYLGGAVSPEHEIPKLMWVRKNLPESYARTARFMDLADWLTWRCTSRDVRSLCTTVCKWTYLAHEKKPDARWHREFFKQVGLLDLLRDGKIGDCIAPMGAFAGALQADAAKALGLAEGTAVAVGIIDAHAGGIGVLGMSRGGNGSKAEGDFDDVLALIGGTSSCHMAVSPRARFVKGVWGPYYSAMVPDYWLNEGGQSATGSLLDFVVKTHAQYPAALKEAKAKDQSIYEFLNARVDDLAARERVKTRAELTRKLHMLPYFHGNRSPNADPSARGAIHGLSLNATMDDYARLYYCTIQAVAYGTRDIIGALNTKGYSIRRIHACGGGTKNPLWIQEHADATGCEVHLPREPEAVLLGSAILAAVGASKFDSIQDAMQSMSAAGEVVRPDASTAGYHAAKFSVFRELYKDHRRYDAMMQPQPQKK